MVKLEFEQRWSRFLHARAQRLRTTEKDAAQPVPSVSLAALKEKAERLGISLESVRQYSKSSQYPTAECITSTELVEFLNGEDISEPTLYHLDECPACCALLDMSTPSEDHLKALMEAVRIRVGEKALRSEGSMSRIFEPA